MLHTTKRPLPLIVSLGRLWMEMQGKVILSSAPRALMEKSTLGQKRCLVRLQVGIPSNQFPALQGLIFKEERSTLSQLSNGEKTSWKHGSIALFDVWQLTLCKDSSDNLSAAEVSLSERSIDCLETRWETMDWLQHSAKTSCHFLSLLFSLSKDSFLTAIPCQGLLILISEVLNAIAILESPQCMIPVSRRCPKMAQWQ